MSAHFTSQGWPRQHGEARLAKSELKLAVPPPAVDSYVAAGAARAVHYLFTKETRFLVRPRG